MMHMGEGMTGSLAHQHPKVYEKIREILVANDVDTNLLAFMSSTNRGGRPDLSDIHIHVSVAGIAPEDYLALAERFGRVERRLPISESSEPAEATEELASAVVERWKASLKP